MSARIIIENLRRFNRKERYYLIRAALGISEFKLGESFRKRLENYLGLRVPEDAFVAMDYHLDWIYASLHLADKGKNLDKAVTDKPFSRYDEKTGCKVITATQQDIDLLIAYGGDNECHLLLLEAKGDDGFNNAQLKKKADRLKGIFGECGRRWSGVEPHFALISRKEPDQKKLTSSGWPKWMRCKGKPDWVKLDWPSNLVSVSRRDKEGNRSSKGKHWLPERKIKK